MFRPIQPKTAAAKSSEGRRDQKRFHHTISTLLSAATPHRLQRLI
jgi:hypothetical protein